MLHVPILIGGYCRTASPRTRKGAMPIVHRSVCWYINCGTRHNIMSFGRGGHRVLYLYNLRKYIMSMLYAWIQIADLYVPL